MFIETFLILRCVWSWRFFKQNLINPNFITHWTKIAFFFSRKSMALISFSVLVPYSLVLKNIDQFDGDTFQFFNRGFTGACDHYTCTPPRAPPSSWEGVQGGSLHAYTCPLKRKRTRLESSSLHSHVYVFIFTKRRHAKELLAIDECYQHSQHTYSPLICICGSEHVAEPLPSSVLHTRSTCHVNP